MIAKCLLFIFGMVAVCCAGIIPAPIQTAFTVGTYASSYNAHAINHAYAAPYVAAPLPYAPALAHSALPAYSPYIAYTAPIIAARR